MSQAMVLWSVNRELEELLEFREEAIATGAKPEELEAIENQINAYASREVKVVDGIATSIATYKTAAAMVRAEAERLLARADMLEARVDRIKESAKQAMESLGIKKLETPSHFLRVQGNGGVDPLEVDADALPDSLKTVALTVQLDVWRQIQQAFDGDPRFQDGTTYGAHVTQPNNEAIRAALKQPCPECNGQGTYALMPDGHEVECSACLGDGKNRVPGARLLPKGTHLRVA